MKWIGLTGGIASGKSTVTKIFRTLGYEFLDADLVSRQITQAEGPALEQIYKTFGQNLRSANGTLNRKMLGDLVFGQVDELKKLEGILHPLVREKIAAERMRLLKAGASAVFYDVPLLYEKRMDGDFEAVVLVYCTREQQLQRLMQRNQFTLAEAEARLSSQLSLDEKRARTAYVIDNSGPAELLENEVRRVLSELQLKSES